MTLPSENRSVANESFMTTDWSMILGAQAKDSPEANGRLESLCRIYWFPLFAYARRKGQSVSDAQDLTQGFFEAFLEKEYLHSVDQNKGRFRSFLLASFSHYMANTFRNANTQKRGGGKRVLSFDFQKAEERFTNEPSHHVNAEQLFEHQWAVTLLNHVLELLRAEQESKGNIGQFDQLKPFLSGAGESGYPDVAENLGMTVPAVKMAVHRLRKRFGELLRQEIARTVASAEEVEDEVRNLFRVFTVRRK